MGPYLSLVVFSQFLKSMLGQNFDKTLFSLKKSWHIQPLSSICLVHNVFCSLTFGGRLSHGLYFGITMDRILALYKKGLRFLCNMWDPRRNDFWNRRRHNLSSPLPRCTPIYGLGWSSMDPFMRGCLADVVLIRHHMNGLAWLETQRVHCPNRSLVVATSKILFLVPCNSLGSL